MIAGKRILITGGGGFVGRTIARHLLDRDPDVIRLFDNNEAQLARVKRSLADDRCRYLMGDVRDDDRLSRAMEGIDVVIHTAAMKHVDISEYNPFEAVKTNVVGLQNLVDAAIDASVERVVFTSSDKAVNPANTMGTTKLLGEKLITAGNKYSGRPGIALACVRFGNVVDSSESVVRVFDEQIRNGGPVTLTDPRMSRFFLTTDELVDLVTGAVERAKGGEIFVRKMPAIRIEDLAEAMIEVFGPEYGYDPAEIEIEVTGRRVGETFEELLMTEQEARRTVETEDTYAILPETGHDQFISHEGLDQFDEPTEIVRSSENAETLDRDSLIDLLEDENVVGVAE